MLIYEVVMLFLIDQLGHRSFQAREAAQKALQRVGEVARHFLVKGEQDAVLERSTRCRWLLTLLDHKHQVSEWDYAGRMLPKGCKQLPWLYLNRNYHSLEAHPYLQAHGAELTGASTNGWQEWRTATQSWLVAQRRDGIDRQSLCDELDNMVWAEISWTWHTCKLWRLRSPLHRY